MALPDSLRAARLTNASLGSAIDDAMGDLEKALAAILGIPIEVPIAAALFTVLAAGLQAVRFQDAGADPTVAGQLQRRGGALKYHDGTRLVDLSRPLAEVPTGVILPYAGAVAPADYLLCDGAVVSRATYAALFAVLGTVYGPGDGTTTFGLPNLKGRAPVGLDAAQSEFVTMGLSGGAKTIGHQHSFDHSHSVNTDTGIQVGGGGIVVNGGSSFSLSHSGHTHAFGVESTGAHGTLTSVQTLATLDPYLVVAYIIKI